MKKLCQVKVILSLAVTLIILCNFSISHAANKPVMLRYGIMQVLTTLDPKDQRGRPDYIISMNVYDSLVYADPDKVVIPWVAESWDVSPDGKKYAFHIKKGIPFHDGTELTAEDVAFSMERMVSMSGTIVSYFKAIKPGTTKVPDKYTVEFNLTKPDSAFLASLVLFRIVNKKLVLANIEEGKYGKFGDYGTKFLRTHEAGSGPYTISDYKYGEYVTLKRFDKYPLTQWKPNSIEIFKLTTIPEIVTLATKFKLGEFDIAGWSFPDETVDRFRKSKNFVVHDDYMDKPWVLGMNNRKPPLDDPFVRKAVNYAYDKGTLINQVMPGGKILEGPLPIGLRGGCTGINTYPYDLEKAKAMLKKSKYSAKDLKNFKLELAGTAGDERVKNVCLFFSVSMKKIGLNVQVRPMRWGEMCQAAAKPETAYHFNAYSQAAKTAHPHQFLMYYTPSTQGISYAPACTYYENPKVTEAVRKGLDAVDLEEQRKYYCEAQKLIAEDAAVVFQFDMVRHYPMWRYIKGYKYPGGAFYWELRFEKFTMDTEDPMFKKNQGW